MQYAHRTSAINDHGAARSHSVLGLDCCFVPGVILCLAEQEPRVIHEYIQDVMEAVINTDELR